MWLDALDDLHDMVQDFAARLAVPSWPFLHAFESEADQGDRATRHAHQSGSSKKERPSAQIRSPLGANGGIESHLAQSVYCAPINMAMAFLSDSLTHTLVATSCEAESVVSRYC